MLTALFLSGLLMAACVAVHAIGAIASLRWLDHSRAFETRNFWPATRVVIALAGWIIGGHLIDVALWALFYLKVRALPGLESSVYFSAVTYTTVGYGDLVLPQRWRVAAGVEALTGILMCGWSTAAFFTIVSLMVRPQLAFDSTTRAETISRPMGPSPRPIGGAPGLRGVPGDPGNPFTG